MSSSAHSYDRLDLVHKTIRRTLEDLALDSALMTDKERKIKQLEHTNDSRCLLCGHIFYGQIVTTCSRCQGLCRVCPSDELAKSGRYHGN